MNEIRTICGPVVNARSGVVTNALPPPSPPPPTPPPAPVVDAIIKHRPFRDANSDDVTACLEMANTISPFRSPPMSFGGGLNLSYRIQQ